MYNVFTDFHHASLLNSLIMLFEGRLGGNVYRPIGLEWAELGYWHVFDHPFTREQFLSTKLGVVEPPPQMYPDGTRPVNKIESITGHPPVYYCHDIDSDKTNKAITFDSFIKMPINIVIASIPQHIEPFKRLCELHPNHPKLIYQIGNAWNIPDGLLVKNVMISAIVPNIPPGINFISYHQEFDVNIFTPGWPIGFAKEGDTMVGLEPGKNIYSFINCFNIERFFKNDWDLFLKVENSMLDWKFKAYGGQCRDGAAHGSKMLAQKMREARFIWHTKWGGDGYGHVLHNSAAVGRPMIVKKEYYNGKMGDSLIIDGKTAITIDNLNVSQIINKIEYYNEELRYIEMCKNVINNFKSIVNFDNEFILLQHFLKNLL